MALMLQRQSWVKWHCLGPMKPNILLLLLQLLVLLVMLMLLLMLLPPPPAMVVLSTMVLQQLAAARSPRSSVEHSHPAQLQLLKPLRGRLLLLLRQSRPHHGHNGLPVLQMQTLALQEGHRAAARDLPLKQREAMSKSGSL
mmetsp:Transcript_47944/g.121712  ORF Transcript_47944/g.121712 Transcript_47944/m.121712 type:complete len:141 (-) Transcript_47944:260-682(-)